MVVLITIFLVIAGLIAKLVTDTQTRVDDAFVSAQIPDGSSGHLVPVAFQHSDIKGVDLEALGIDPSLAALSMGLMSSGNLIACDTVYTTENITKAETLGQSLASTVGLSASPMFGFLAANVVKRARCGWDVSDDNAPWFMKNEIFYLLCAAALIVLFKDLLLSWLPVLKAPIDGLEQVMKLGLAVVTLPTIATLFTASASGGMMAPEIVSGTGDPGALLAADFAGFISPAIMSGETAIFGLGGIAQIVETTQGLPRFWVNYAIAIVGLFVTFVMWVSAGFIGGLVMLMPLPLFDSFLRGLRATAILGIASLAIFMPVIALIVAVLIFLLALFIFPWSFRLLSFGIMNAADFLPFRFGGGNGNRSWDRAFTGQGLRELPRRTAGRLVAEGESLVFSYSPFFILPRKAVRIDDKNKLTVVEGVLMPSLRLGFGGTGPAAFLMPARYRKHGETLSKRYGIGYSRKSVDGTVTIQNPVRTPT